MYIYTLYLYIYIYITRQPPPTRADAPLYIYIYKYNVYIYIYNIYMYTERVPPGSIYHAQRSAQLGESVGGEFLLLIYIIPCGAAPSLRPPRHSKPTTQTPPRQTRRKPGSPGLTLYLSVYLSIYIYITRQPPPTRPTHTLRRGAVTTSPEALETDKTDATASDAVQAGFTPPSLRVDSFL